MPRPDKAAAVREIAHRFEEAAAALLTEYRGLHVGDIAEVRGALREAETEYKVLKNTLTRLAVREVGLDELVEMLQGPTAIAFVKGDAVQAAKALDDAAKKFPVLVIKGGVIEGKIIDAEQARALAKLEPRETQLAKIVMMVNQPLQQTANVLSALLRDFGSMLGQVLQQKESEAPAAEPAAAPEAAEAAPAEAESAPAAEDDSAAAASASEEPEAAAETSSEAPAAEAAEDQDEGGADEDAEAADDDTTDENETEEEGKE